MAGLLKRFAGDTALIEEVMTLIVLHERPFRQLITRLIAEVDAPTSE